jgi:thioredoxin 1
MMPPILKELKNMTGDDVVILKMDVDRNPKLAAAYQVQSVPTLMVFRNGEVKWRQSGVMNARELKGVIDRFKV